MREELAISLLPHPEFLVVLWLHAELDPPAEQWTAVVESLVKARRARGVSLDRVRSLVISDGGSPNAGQRIQIVRDLHEGQPTRVGVVTLALSNPVKRGLATAMSWVNPSIRFFQPARFQDALAYLELSDQRSEVEREYRVLKQRCGRLVRIFDQVAF